MLLIEFQHDVAVELDKHIDVTRNLSKIGWKRIGEGTFSTIYKSPDGKVALKVNHLPDPAFKKFTSVIKDHPSPHFPLISDIKTLRGGKTAYMMELLEPIKPKDKIKFKKFIMNCEYIGENPYSENSDVPYPSVHISDSFTTALKILGENKGNNSMDIHGDNIMRRNDGTLVIADPYSPL